MGWLREAGFGEVDCHFKWLELALVVAVKEATGSFARTAIDELAEETGIEVSERDLIPFGCLSEAEAHTIHYPNGDVTHCFALLLPGKSLEGRPPPRPGGVDRGEVRRPGTRPPSRSTLRPRTPSICWTAYLRSGSFQVR